MKPPASLPPKRKVKPTNHYFAQYATPPHNRIQRVLGVNGHSGLESDLLDTFGLTVPLERHQPPAGLLLLLSAAN
nr:unnamed protein product [Spirometra erinaceieuropaei]